MSALQVKCYLNKDRLTPEQVSASNEIRRFTLAQTTATGVHNQLLEKILNAYGADLLPNKYEIKTFWIDEENEFVCFSSDAELQYAIDYQTAVRISKPYESGQASNVIFKVYIVRKPIEAGKSQSEIKAEEAATSGSGTQDEYHPGIMCDGCDKDIYGTRYKCNKCIDYDLCSKCHDQGIHSHHDFNKILKPGKRCPYFGRARGHGHGHGHGWRHRFQQQQQQQSSSDQPTASHPRAATNPLHETLNNFLPYIATSIPIVNDPEQLKNVGEYLKQFLDPFGIDVSYYVDSINRANPNTAKKVDQETTPVQEEKPKEDSKAKEVPSENLMDTTEKSREPVPEVLIPTTSAGSSIEIIPLVAAHSVEPSAPSMKEDLIDLKPKQVINEQSISPFEQAAAALKTVIENNASAAVAKESEKSVEEEEQSIGGVTADIPKLSPKRDEEDGGFNLIDIEKELKFINCIEQLRSMGYNDDAGWLTRLVIAKEGNINSVLDSLHPSKN